jgi:hypothetical protein
MEPVVDIAIKNARAYAARHGLLLVERLGFGIHGSIHVVEDKILDWSSAHAKRASREWNSGPAKVHYLWWLSALGEPHIWCFLERFWRNLPQIAAVGLVGGFRDDGASSTREEPAEET